MSGRWRGWSDVEKSQAHHFRSRATGLQSWFHRAIPDLAKRGVRIAIGTRTVPVGRYAREALRAMSADPSFPRDFARRVLANVMSEETDVKAVATKVALGEADAGVVYATDVAPLGTKLRSFPIPGRYARQPTYVIAIVKGASDRHAALSPTLRRCRAAQC
jgi:molybdate transport system substrate-binding protein